MDRGGLEQSQSIGSPGAGRYGQIDGRRRLVWLVRLEYKCAVVGPVKLSAQGGLPLDGAFHGWLIHRLVEGQGNRTIQRHQAARERIGLHQNWGEWVYCLG